MPVRLPIVGNAPDPLAPLRRAVAGNMQAAFTVDRFPQEQYTDPPGDAGLFGPDSVTWRVHGHPSAIIGGFSSLMLQALHPLVMAGVAEHSSYKEDPLGRLGRTASFVGGTTYGSTEVAEAMIATVKAVHRHVRGIAPDGRPYVATDPELVTWVHVAEMGSILWAHRRYHPRPVRGTDLDRYFEETAVVAEKLGGTGIPRSRAEVRDYFHDIRGELVADTQAIEALAFIMQPMGRDPVARGVSNVIIQASLDLLPAWARSLYGIRRPPGFDATVVRPAAFAFINALDALSGPSLALEQAKARAAATPRLAVAS
jgi:uncharacterized protein (DUF2236 family)